MILGKLLDTFPIKCFLVNRLLFIDIKRTYPIPINNTLPLI